MSKSQLPKRILVGLSCTLATEDPPLLQVAPTDRHTFEQALWVASRVGAEIRLVHVTDFVDEDLAGAEHLDAIVRGGVGADIDAMVAQAAEQGVQTSVGWARGRPWYELIQDAHRHRVDLIMISPRRESLSMASRIWHGSTARRIIRKAPCPVWVVDPERPLGVRKVLALVDRSEVSRNVVTAAGELARAVGAERHLIHCLEFPGDLALRRLPDARRSIERYHDTVRESARADLEKLVDGDDGWTITLLGEWVASAVPKLVEEHKADLAILASSSYDGLAGLLLGSTAEAILDRASVSTWVLRPEGWTSPVRLEEEVRASAP